MKLLLNHQPNLANLTLSAIIKFTIIEHQLHVIDELLNLRIFLVLDIGPYRAKVHGIFNYLMIVWNLQRLHIDCLTENVGLGVLKYVGDDSEGCLLPLIKDRGTLRHFRHCQIANLKQVFALLIDFEVFGQLRVVCLEVLKLCIGHWLIMTILSQNCEQVPTRHLPLISPYLGLLRLSIHAVDL